MVHAEARSSRRGRRVWPALAIVVGSLSPGVNAQAQAKKAAPATIPYVPPAGSWERRAPGAVGMDSAKLAAAVAFAIEKESRNPRDLELNHYQTFGREPFGAAIGPIAPRGAPTGVIVRHGYVVAEWGDPAAVEMTHSVTKSMLSYGGGRRGRSRHHPQRLRHGGECGGPDPHGGAAARPGLVPIVRPRGDGSSRSTRRTTVASRGTTCCAR